MKIGLIIVVVLLSNFCYSQTTIIAVVEDSAIYLGADTKFISKDSISFGCKAFVRDSFLFGTYGYLANLQEIFIGNKSRFALNTVIDNYANKFAELLASQLEQTKDKHPDQFEFIKSNQQNSLGGTLFCGVSNGMPILISVTFKMIESGVRIGVAWDRQQVISKAIAGHVRSIIDLYNKDETWKLGVVNGITDLLNIEIKTDPNFVGGKIDIVRLKNGVAERVVSSSLCN
jgi:hypothetical protein